MGRGIMENYTRNKLLQGVVFASYALSFILLYLILDVMIFYEWWLHFWLHTTINYPIWTYYFGQIIIALLVAVLIAFSSFMLGNFTLTKLGIHTRGDLNG
ncbi:hypothetical protein [Candidatus Borrarchaeum sp.]|uniref:hypothetical protein n=1 Tax=Candidatus Borrarchaeum sp. TaxID=2846742 RepID=UPI00257CD40B|nr:hypothetical protein [Candidatus Borrarchaeum sp.]